MADDKKAGIANEAVTLGAFTREVVSGSTAYVVVGATYTFTQKGTPMREAGADDLRPEEISGGVEDRRLDLDRTRPRSRKIARYCPISGPIRASNASRSMR